MTGTETTAAPAVAEPEKTPSPTAAEAPTATPENGNGETAEQTNGTTEKKEEEKKEPVKEMRSIVLTGFGGYKGVKILKKPEPTAQKGEVLIRVKAW
jgi:hypothetical protein